MGVGEPGPLKQDDLSQAPSRSDGGGCLCGSADQRETGGGTSTEPADPSHPASHLFHRYWILLEISLRPVLQILRSHWLYQLFLRTWLHQVIWAQFHQILWLPKLWSFCVRHHFLSGISAAAFYRCCSGSGP